MTNAANTLEELCSPFAIRTDRTSSRGPGTLGGPWTYALELREVVSVPPAIPSPKLMAQPAASTTSRNGPAGSRWRRYRRHIVRRLHRFSRGTRQIAAWAVLGREGEGAGRLDAMVMALWHDSDLDAEEPGDEQPGDRAPAGRQREGHPQAGRTFEAHRESAACTRRDHEASR